jgi:hypothetical protein
VTWPRWALTLWLILGIAVSVRTLVQPEKHTVYPIFVTGAHRWWQNLPLYVKQPPLDYFRYAPTFAVCMTPFGWLDLRTGGILWSWVNLAVYAAGLWCFVRDVLPVSWTPARRAGFFVLALAGGLSPIWNGQSNPLVIGLLLLAASAFVCEQWWTASILLTLPVVLKLTPLVVGLMFAALWPRKLAGRLCVALGVAALVPFLTRSPGTVLEQYAGWLDQMHELRDQRWIGFRDAWAGWVTACHFVSWQDGPVPLETSIANPAYRVVQVLAAGCVLAWCLRQRRHNLSKRRLITVTLGMGVAWLMLFGPATEFPTYVLLAPLLSWAILEETNRAWARLAVYGAAVLILVLGWNAIGQALTGLPLATVTLPLGTILFTGWLVAYTRRASALDAGELLERQHQRVRPLPAPALRLDRQVELVGQR